MSPGKFKQVNKTQMTTILSRTQMMTAGALLLLGLSACSSSSRVMYLGSGTTKTVQLRETVKEVKAWAKDSTGVAIPVIVDLMEGGYFRNDLSR